MLDDLENRQSNNSKETYDLIISCFMNLSFIDFVISNNYINSEHIEKLIKFITIDSISACHSNLIKTSMPFLINFFIKSFEISIYDNFNIFTQEKSEIIKSMFSILTNFANSSLYSEENFIISFLISCFFLTISLKSTVWEILNEKKMIKPCCDFIKKFIYDTFSKKHFSNDNNPKSDSNPKQDWKTNEEINIEKEKNKKNLNERLIAIKLLGKILGFIAKEKIFKRIYHIELFRYIFDFVLDLFHVDYTEINYDVYNIFNVCTYYSECKLYLYIEKEKIFYKIRKNLFSRIKSSLQNYNYLKESINKNEETKKISNSKKEEIENEEIKQNLNLKLNLFDSINDKSKIFAALNFRDFSILISILSNLLIMNDYSIFKQKLFNNIGFNFEQFKKDLVIFIEDFDKKSNFSSRAVNFEKIIHPVKVFLLIIDPMIKFSGKNYLNLKDEKKSDSIKKEKKIYLDILKDLKRQLSSSEKDVDSHHKVYF